MQMWAFYWSLTREGFDRLVHMQDRGLNILFVFAVVIALFNQPLAGRVLSMEGFDLRWALIPLIVLFLFNILRANHQRYLDIVKQRDEARERLRHPLVRVQPDAFVSASQGAVEGQTSLAFVKVPVDVANPPEGNPVSLRFKLHMRGLPFPLTPVGTNHLRPEAQYDSFGPHPEWRTEAGRVDLAPGQSDQFNLLFLEFPHDGAPGIDHESVEIEILDMHQPGKSVKYHPADGLG